MKKITAVLIGAGMRGREAYAPYTLDSHSEMKIIAVAEPIEERRKIFCELYGIPDSMSFKTWEDLLAQPKLADVAMICNQDKDHFAPTMLALEKGYHVLLEKPMSNKPDECVQMVRQAEKYGRILTICHVLRYTPFFTNIKKLLEDGVIGDIVTIEHSENVAYWHQAHSYVRGNWRNTAQSSPMILAKSCHDLDIICWLVDKKCRKVSSFGSLKHFRKENAPEGAPERCLDGCPHKNTCPYYAPKIYVDWNGNWQADILKKVVSQDTSREALIKALREGPYGRCVYHCDNDVVDHQVVIMEFENDITASFTMCAFTYENTRKIRVLGTKGELWGDMDKNYIEYVDFLKGDRITIKLNQSEQGHGGGDYGIIRDFIQCIKENTDSRTSAKKSLQSHLMAFAAEESRLNNKVVDMDLYLEAFGK